MTTFTKEQMDALSGYETYFDTITRANWSSYPGREALEAMNAIMSQATGEARTLKLSCAKCWGGLLRDCAKIYYQTKETTAIKRKRNGNKKNQH